MCTLTSKYVTMRIFAQRVYNQDNNQELVIWFNVDTIQWGTKTTQYITTIDHIDNNYIDDSYHDMDYLSKQDTLQHITITFGSRRLITLITVTSNWLIIVTLITADDIRRELGSAAPLSGSGTLASASVLRICCSNSWFRGKNLVQRWITRM